MKKMEFNLKKKKEEEEERVRNLSPKSRQQEYINKFLYKKAPQTGGDGAVKAAMNQLSLTEKPDPYRPPGVFERGLRVGETTPSPKKKKPSFDQYPQAVEMPQDEFDYTIDDVIDIKQIQGALNGFGRIVEFIYCKETNKPMSAVSKQNALARADSQSVDKELKFSSQNLHVQNVYEGEFKNGIFNGFGRILDA